MIAPTAGLRGLGVALRPWWQRSPTGGGAGTARPRRSAPDSTESASRWIRTNHAGATVTLAEGPIAVAALLAGVGDRTGCWTARVTGAWRWPSPVSALGVVGALRRPLRSDPGEGLPRPPSCAAFRRGDQRDDQDSRGRPQRGGRRSADPARAAWLSEAGLPCPGRLARHRTHRGHGQPHQSARPAAGPSGEGGHPARRRPVRLRCRAGGRRCCGQPADRSGSAIHAR